MRPRKIRMVGGRRCSVCGEVYYRVNKIHVWTAMNPGHRMGWILEELNLCGKCFSARSAQRIVAIATVAQISDQRRSNG